MSNGTMLIVVNPLFLTKKIIIISEKILNYIKRFGQFSGFRHFIVFCVLRWIF